MKGFGNFCFGLAMLAFAAFFIGLTVRTFWYSPTVSSLSAASSTATSATDTRPTSANPRPGFSCGRPQPVQLPQGLRYAFGGTYYDMSPPKSPRDALCVDGKTAYWDPDRPQ